MAVTTPPYQQQVRHGGRQRPVSPVRRMNRFPATSAAWG